MKILSYNIQAAINTSSYLSYSYQWPRQILPTPAKRKTLARIAEFINGFDAVCLQEAELGGLRNGFQSQHEQLLAMTDFTYSLAQTNRRIWRLSLHGNLILSKLPIREILNAPLPSRIPGRGVLAGEITLPDGRCLTLVNAHLSLGGRDQHIQLRYIRTQLRRRPYVLLCGDLNTTPDDSPLRILTEHGWRRLTTAATFPSWNPQKTLDHALIKGGLAASAAAAPFTDSDHLPIAIEIPT